MNANRLTIKKLDLETPALIVDQERLVRNIKGMQETANSAGVLLRPHSKTHNCPELAKLQVEMGAKGICVQDMRHAEEMVHAGVTDIFIANEVVDSAKIARLAELQEKASVKVAIDDLTNAEQIAKTATSHDRSVPVLVDVDVGAGRCGVPFNATAKLVERLARLKGIRFDGLMGYEGQFYNVRNRQRREKLAKRVIAQLVTIARLIEKSGLDVPTVSCGITPTASAAANVEGVTEIQPGNYVFYDLMQVELGVATIEQCAQRVLTTVISTPDSKRFVVDAGTTAFAYDQARFPKTLGLQSAIPTEINQEHLIMRINPKVAHVQVGERLEFLPYHACTVTNLFDQICITKGEDVTATWAVARRN
jgi:D-serine deaminase-like pyridoxal phosphate-dependent protein